MTIEMKTETVSADKLAAMVLPAGQAGIAPAVKSAGTRPRLALFDLDHTLIPMDSDYEWGEFTIALG